MVFEDLISISNFSPKIFFKSLELHRLLISTLFLLYNSEILSLQGTEKLEIQIRELPAPG